MGIPLLIMAYPKGKGVDPLDQNNRPLCWVAEELVQILSRPIIQ